MRMKNAAERTAAIEQLPLPTPSARTPARYRAANDAPSPHGEEIQTRDGRRLRLRAIHPDDVVALQRGFARLSPKKSACAFCTR